MKMMVSPTRESGIVCTLANEYRLMTPQGRRVRGYRDLQVWQLAMDLVVDAYRLTKGFPKHETYGLTVQLRGAAVSVPANIAEGHGREHLGDYLHHLSIANGSLMELETHCIIAVRLEYLPRGDARALLDRTAELGRMLAGLIRALKRRRRS